MKFMQRNMMSSGLTYMDDEDGPELKAGGDRAYHLFTQAAQHGRRSGISWSRAPPAGALPHGCEWMRNRDEWTSVTSISSMSIPI